MIPWHGGIPSQTVVSITKSPPAGSGRQARNRNCRVPSLARKGGYLFVTARKSGGTKGELFHGTVVKRIPLLTAFSADAVRNS